MGPSPKGHRVRNTRWRKALRDLSHNKGRTSMVIAAMAVGVAAVGSILTGYSVMIREMDRGYSETNPASSVLHLDPVDAQLSIGLAASVEARREIVSAEARGEVAARLIRGPDQWVPLVLVVVADFDAVDVARFNPEEGKWGPAADEIVIERSSLEEVDLSVGDGLTVTIATGSEQTLTVAGLVHDPGRTPAWMSGLVIGYITPEGLSRLGPAPVLDELHVVIDGDGDRADNRRLVEELRSDLEEEGVAVRRVEVPVPKEHPSQPALRTFLFLLQAFGAVALVASGALVATLITAQMKEQSREIGVMKALGAQTGQIAGIYMGSVALLAVAGLIIGLPLGLLGGRGFVTFSFGLLNLDVESYLPNAWVIPVQIFAALLIPLLAVAYPVLRNSRLPVREVISDTGTPIRRGLAGPGAAVMGRIQRLGPTATLGIRNAFRSPSRTALTILALSLGGAAFMVALNTGVAWDRAVDSEFEARRYDLAIDLDQGYPTGQIAEALDNVSGVTFEVWNRYPTVMSLPDGVVGDAFELLVPTEDTAMIDFPVIEGRWLEPGDQNAIVITQALDDPPAALGDAVSLDIDGVRSAWTVVGRVSQLTAGPNGAAYASNPPDGARAEELANHIRAANDDSTSPLLSKVEESLTSRGLGIASIATADEGRESLEDHLFIIVGLLLIMAILVSVVGGLGLIEAMTITVLERRREIGVMRAVGATDRRVLQVVIIEGAVIAGLSWLVAAGLSIPATLLVQDVTGNLFLEAPLPTSFSALGVGIWLILASVLAVIASAIPAFEATEVPVHQMLAYE